MAAGTFPGRTSDEQVTYHANNNGTATLGINRLYWDTNDWPVLTNDWSAFYPLDVDAREGRILGVKGRKGAANGASPGEREGR